MPSNFPTGADNLATNKTADTVASSDHPNHHDDLASAVNAVQSYLLTAKTPNNIPPAITQGGTISTSTAIARVAPSQAATGVILQAGTTNGQSVIVFNESPTANSLTFADAPTSHVANGSLVTVAGLSYMTLVWNTATSLWYAPGGVTPPSNAGTPTGLTALAGDGTVALNWTAATNTTSYNVEQSDLAAGPYTVVGTTQTLAFTVSSLLNAHTYFFRIRAFAGSIPGGVSTVVSASPVAAASVPVAPSLVSLTPGPQKIDGVLNPVGNATSYQLFISTNTSFSTVEQTITATAFGQSTNYTFTLTTIGGVNLVNGTTYNVMARAVNAVGTSANSSLLSATPAASAVTYQAQVLATTGEVGFWELSESSGTSAADQTASPHNGTWDFAPTDGITGHPRANGRTGARTDGSQHVTVSDVAALHLNDTLTMAAWVRRGATQSQDMAIVSKGAGSYYMRISAGNTLQLVRSQTWLICSSTTTITDTTNWHYVVVTKSGSTVHLYLDGVDVSGTVTDSTLVDNTHALNIGSDQGGERYVGDIMDVQLYNVALSAQTVSDHYNGVGGTTTNPLTISAQAGYAHVMLSWSGGPSNAGMYRISRRVSGVNPYVPIETIPGTSMIDTTVTGGTAYDYTVAAKTPDPATGLYRLGPESSVATVTAGNTLPSEGSMATINTQVSGATAGATVNLTPGIYRVAKDGAPTFNKNLTLRAASRDVWFLCSRDWGTSREVGNTWTPVGGYWRSQRTAPTLTPASEDPNQISNNTLTSFYNNVTVWNTNGGSQWLTPIAAGSTPVGNQVCYESSGDHRLRIGVNPASWQRIEVTEALSWGGASANNIIFDGLTFRGAGGGGSDASLDIRSRQGIQFVNCVMGNTHAGGITMYQGETTTPCNILIENCWFDRCGYAPLSASTLNGVTVRRCRFDSTGGQGYNEIWHGGVFKFVGGPINILCEYNVSYNTTGATFWADISAGPYEVRYNKCAHNTNFPCFSHEISVQGNVHHNLFWDGGLTSDASSAHTDQGNTLNFHDNTVVGNDGTSSGISGRVIQFQGGTGSGTFRPDIPPGGVFGNSFQNNWFIHRSTHDAFTWSFQSGSGKFTFNGNKWYSYFTPLWRFDPYNNSIPDITTWNAIADVGTDSYTLSTDADRELMRWGIITDTTTGGS